MYGWGVHVGVPEVCMSSLKWTEGGLKVDTEVDAVQKSRSGPKRYHVGPLLIHPGAT